MTTVSEYEPGTVVLDLTQIPSALTGIDDETDWAYVIKALREDANGYERTLLSIADQIEAQVKSPDDIADIIVAACAKPTPTLEEMPVRDPLSEIERAVDFIRRHVVMTADGMIDPEDAATQEAQ